MISFSGLSPEVAEAMCTPMHLILPSTPPSPRPQTANPGALYLGSISAVLDPSILKEHNIQHLVQVLDVPWLPKSQDDGYECYRMDILDLESQDLNPHLEDAVEDIDSALHRGRNVLVHCQQVGIVSLSIYIFAQSPSWSPPDFDWRRWRSFTIFWVLILFAAGCLPLGINCYSISHSQTWHVIRHCNFVCPPASPVH
jgi:hypothetical protein